MEIDRARILFHICTIFVYHILAFSLRVFLQHLYVRVSRINRIVLKSKYVMHFAPLLSRRDAICEINVVRMRKKERERRHTLYFLVRFTYAATFARTWIASHASVNVKKERFTFYRCIVCSIIFSVSRLFNTRHERLFIISFILSVYFVI